MRSRLLTKAKLLLSAGHPLPIDLVSRLVALGVDVSTLERKYAK